MLKKTPFLLLGFAIASLCAAVQAPARGDDIGHDAARQLLREGRILPLSEIVKAVSSKVTGEVIEVELELEDGIYVYELKIIRPDGRVQELEVDAATGNILDLKDDDD